MKISKISIAKIGFEVDVPSTNDYEEVGRELFKAFEQTGFAYIQDHGIEDELIARSMSCSRDFFMLPKEEKDVFERDAKVQQGYVEPGREVFTDTTDQVTPANKHTKV